MPRRGSTTPPVGATDSINTNLLRDAIRQAGLNPNTSPLTSRRSSTVSTPHRPLPPSRTGSSRRITSAENVRLRTFRRVDQMPSFEYPSLLPGGVRRESVDSRHGSISESRRPGSETMDFKQFESSRESVDARRAILEGRRYTIDFQSDPRLLEGKEQREHIRELARRGSVIPEDVMDANRRASMNPPALELMRRGSLRTEDSYVRRRETVDGGAVKDMLEFLKTKGLVTDEDIWSKLSTGTASLSTLMSLIEPAETNPNDPHSYSRCDSVFVQKIIFHWNLDFKKQVICGDVTLDIKRRKEGANSVSLDSYLLDIQNVTVNGNKVNYVMYAKKGEFGTKMDIDLPDRTSDLYMLRIEYETNPNATGLTWIPACEAEGRPFPFVFSKNVSIQCRSILPLQDTPSNQISYVARVRAPTNLKVLMSAAKERQFVMGADGYSTHYFRQDFPVAPRNIAFIAGHMSFTKIGERTTVWAHSSIVEKTARELVGTEELLCIAEAMCGEYRWKSLDIVVLPPTDMHLAAFESPGMIFLNPNILTGDKCISHYIAHEIAHNWLGSLVTHSNYEHLWLTEGITNYVSRKIIGKKYGQETRLFAASRGLKELKMAVDIYGHSHPLTCLVTDLSERSPLEAVLTIPYEKGHTLMYFLEHLIDDAHEMEQYIKEYLTTFKRRSITSFMFKDHFTEFFSKHHAIKGVDWYRWFNSPGMPPFIPDYHTYLEDACSTLVDMWTRWERHEKCPFSANDLNVMNSLQIMEVLDQMMDEAPFPLFKLEKMHELYAFESNKNRLVVLKWYLLCLRGRWSSKADPALRFAKEDGQQLYLLAVYRALNEHEDMREEAVIHFMRTKGSMSVETVRLVTATLHLDGAEDASSAAGPYRKRSGAVRSDERTSLGARRRSSVTSQSEEAAVAAAAAAAAVALSIRRRSVLPPRGSSLGSLGVAGGSLGSQSRLPSLLHMGIASTAPVTPISTTPAVSTTHVASTAPATPNAPATPTTPVTPTSPVTPTNRAASLSPDAPTPPHHPSHPPHHPSPPHARSTSTRRPATRG